MSISISLIIKMAFMLLLLLFSGCTEKEQESEHGFSDWFSVGGSSNSTDGIGSLRFAIYAQDNSYLTYLDNIQAGKITVKYSNGTQYNTLGVEGFSSGVAKNISLAIDNNSVPYFAYIDGDNAMSYSVVSAIPWV